jgi:spermidine/putrescine transport system permease protein
MALPPRQRVEVFALTAPAYLWLAATVFLPLVAMVYFSFLTAVPVGGRTASFTLAHYISFFTKPIYWFNAWRSIELGIYVTLISLLVGYPAALALSRHVRGRWREAIFLLRQPLNLLFTYPAIVIGLVHAYLPYAILTSYISLQAIDESLVEASRSLGATTLQTFFRIILPLSMPGVLAAIFLIFVPVIGSFMEPRILGGKDAIMLGPIIEGQFTAAFNWPLGAALSFMMLAIVLLMLALAAPLLRRQLGST